MRESRCLRALPQGHSDVPREKEVLLKGPTTIRCVCASVCITHGRTNHRAQVEAEEP